MWLIFLLVSIGVLALVLAASFTVNGSSYTKKHSFNLLNASLAGVFLSAIFMFYPIHYVLEESTPLGGWRAFLLSFFNAMQIFGAGCEFGVAQEGLALCPSGLNIVYQIWVATLFVVAPILTFGFVLSLFKNLSASIKYVMSYFKDVYIFSELNEKSLVLANDIKSKNPNAAIVFTDVFEENKENSFEMMVEAKKIRAICFKNDVLAVNFSRHSADKNVYFFMIGQNETENLNQSLKILELYSARKNTHLYVGSTSALSELTLSSGNKGEVKVRRINEVRSLVNRVLYERGEILFDSARKTEDGVKQISAVIVGMGRHGTEMLKALSWFGQMDGYELKITGFDRDPLAKERLCAMAPELMSEKYNGVKLEGEAYYKIDVHPGLEAGTASFVDEIMKIKDATYVLVSLGDDDLNISTAVNLRMYFERMKIHPVIQAIVYNSQQKRALEGIKNFSDQEYDIDFIGDMESSFVMDVIVDSKLEEEALERHLKWGVEETFWNYEYNYRSSVASAIHMRARIKCGIPGADKPAEELTEKELRAIETLEHRRWNAYMRAEGYVFSGSTDKSSRNNLAKMHHDLVDYSSLHDDEKRKDARVGTK